jgi:very-short-patch-repair endonuclease
MTVNRRIRLPLAEQCRAFDLPEPVAEYRFAEERRFRFDWAWPERRIAVEEDGGIWIRGRHNHPAGYLRDMEKLNLAAELGWRVLRYETGRVDIAQLARVLAA